MTLYDGFKPALPLREFMLRQFWVPVAIKGSLLPHPVWELGLTDAQNSSLLYFYHCGCWFRKFFTDNIKKISKLDQLNPSLSNIYIRFLIHTLMFICRLFFCIEDISRALKYFELCSLVSNMVAIYKTTRLHIQEDSTFNVHYLENLKSWKEESFKTLYTLIFPPVQATWRSHVCAEIWLG